MFSFEVIVTGGRVGWGEGVILTTLVRYLQIETAAEVSSRPGGPVRITGGGCTGDGVCRHHRQLPGEHSWMRRRQLPASTILEPRCRRASRSSVLMKGVGGHSHPLGSHSCHA